MLLLLLLMAVNSITIQQGKCSTSQDCQVFTDRLQQQEPLFQQQGGYSCIDKQCVYTVASNNLCTSNRDCAAYGYILDSIERNITLNFDYNEFLSNLCAPQHCTIQSDCLEASGPLLKNNNILGGCCRGIPVDGTCALNGMELCTDQHHCYPDSNPNSNSRICTVLSKNSTQWIGIVLTLLGAATSNMGLNIQKYAHRKRFEKQTIIKERGKMGILYGLGQIKVSLTNLYRNMSKTSLGNNRNDTDVGFNNEHNNTGMTNNENITGMTNDTSSNGMNTTNDNFNQFSASDADRIEFQKRLGMNQLFKNPVFIFLILEMVIGNVGIRFGKYLQLYCL